MSQKKYLDLAGLTAYDEKIKAWHQKHLGVISDDEILALFKTEDGYTLTVLKKVDISNITYDEVDLGLSVKWANKNIGAQTVEDYGTYFSWGNTEGYTVSGTKFLTVDEACQLFSSVTGQTVTTKEELENMLNQMGLTVNNLGTGTVDGYSFDETTYNGTSGAEFTGDVLDSTHDAATSIMGNSWRMPTIDEYKELVNAVKTSVDDTTNPLTCTYIYLDKQGNRTEHIVYRENTKDYFSVSGLTDDNDNMLFNKILGIKFTNTSTGTSVYFPACGSVDGSLLAYIGFIGIYWSSSVNDTTNALGFDFFPSHVYAISSNLRCYGLCVRGVHA